MPHGLQNMVLSPRQNLASLGKKYVLNMYGLLHTFFSLYSAQGLYDLIFQHAYVYKGAWHKPHLCLTWQKLIIHDQCASLTVSDTKQNETGWSHVFQTTCVPAIKSATCEVTMKHWWRREIKYNSKHLSCSHMSKKSWTKNHLLLPRWLLGFRTINTCSRYLSLPCSRK
jgi:hypothetical protein